jgi:hypothetical protein
MRLTRVLAVLWFVLGVAIWNGFYDLYISRSAREYGQLRVEAEQGRGPEPDMMQVMAQAKRDGAQAASIWAVLVVAGGWTTVWVATRAGRR